jgi:adenine-specific DNA-methyltransferase
VAELESRITDYRDRLLMEKSLEKSIQIAGELFQLYSSYRNDSALHYAELCISLADSLHRPDLVGRFRSLLAYQCSNSDMDNESLEQLRLVKRSALDSLGLVDYYHAWMHVYGELGSYTQREHLRLDYFAQQDAYRDSVLMVADEGSEEWLHLKVDVLCARQLYQDALALSKEWLKMVTDGTDQGGISKAQNWKGGSGFKFYELAPSLLKHDKFGNLIINKDYNADMLAAAMAKQEGYTYQPDSTLYWKQGQSSEHDYIYTTTQFLTVESLDAISETMQDGESLLICCTAFQKECQSHAPNITVKKIPQMLLGRCEFGKDDYSLNIIDMPQLDLEEDLDDFPEEEPTAEAKNNKPVEGTLFD